MAFKTRTAVKLQADVAKILDGVGSDYRMSFLLTAYAGTQDAVYQYRQEAHSRRQSSTLVAERAKWL